MDTDGETEKTGENKQTNKEPPEFWVTLVEQISEVKNTYREQCWIVL